MSAISTNPDRRRLLQAGASILTLGFCGRLFAAPLTGPRFLLVFLRGGYDAASALIPYSSSFYYESRPRISIAPPRPGADAGALALDADWALAPALRPTLGALFQQRQVAFVPFAGTSDLSRSHFETQDSIELGQPLEAARDYGSGFLGRLLLALNSPAAGAPPAIAFTDALPLTFHGPMTVANMSLKNPGRAAFDERQAHILADMYAGTGLQTAVTDGLELRAQVAQTMRDEMAASGRNAINARGFELEAERMARLMLGQYRIGFVDIGGWDTHVGQGNAAGALANNLSGLGRGLSSFAQALGEEWSNTVVVVVSEFGRTFRENGNGGTDHGHGSVYWVLGGSMRGGRIAGESQSVTRATLFQDRDYPVLNDYRGVLGGLFQRLWGLSPARLQQVFPQADATDLQLL